MNNRVPLLYSVVELYVHAYGGGWHPAILGEDETFCESPYDVPWYWQLVNTTLPRFHAVWPFGWWRPLGGSSNAIPSCYCLYPYEVPPVFSDKPTK